MNILIYSFEEFSNLKTNPACEVGKEISKLLNSNKVFLIRLSVTYNCWGLLKRKILEVKPDFILGIGVAIGINRVKIEKIGLNYKYAEILDNKGTRTTFEKINNSKRLAYETKVNVLNFVNQLKERGIPSEISFHAGTYICNYVYYSCLEYLSNKNIKSLFIHVPASPNNAIELNKNIPTFPPFLIAKGIFQILNKMKI